MFKHFDRNNDGHVSVKEMRHILQLLGNNPTEEDVKLIINDVDKNGE